jgi:hypothetical protein
MKKFIIGLFALKSMCSLASPNLDGQLEIAIIKELENNKNLICKQRDDFIDRINFKCLISKTCLVTSIYDCKNGNLDFVSKVIIKRNVENTGSILVMKSIRSIIIKNHNENE